MITATSKVNNVSTTLTINVNKKQSSASFIDNVVGGVYACTDSEDIYEGSDCYSNKLEILSSTKAKFTFESTSGFFTSEFESNIVIDENNKTITFTSFDIIDGDYDEYLSYYMPAVRQNVAYQISNDGSEINLNLLCIDGGEELDFGTLNSEITTIYTFKKEN